MDSPTIYAKICKKGGGGAEGGAGVPVACGASSAIVWSEASGSTAAGRVARRGSIER